jgi:methylated-DNA-protein-cysteine methyltransferase-like protein
VADLGFEAAVVAAIRSLAPGEIATYGEIAAEAGRPGAARAVGRLLATTDEDLPWWRVVTAGGRLVPGHEDRHAQLLRAEGVDASDGRIQRPRRAPAP